MFYKKHLQSLEDLQAERAALKRKAKKKAKALSKESDKKGNALQEGIGFLSGSLTGNAALAPIIEIASKMALPYLVKRGAQLGVRKLAFTAAKEVAFGYTKWKLASIVVKIIANKIKNRNKKEA